MGFSQALSGVNAASANLNVIGNNIANSATVGFKSSRTLFSDVYAGSKVGLGTKVAGVMQNFNDGNLETTDRNLDIAIAGTGFLKFSQNGTTVYSRNGQLNMTPEGFLVNAQGDKLMGANGVIQVPADGMPAKATDSVKQSVNLNSGDPIIAAAFNPADSTTYSYTNTANTYDSLGNLQKVQLYYTKTGVNTWEVRAGINGTASVSAPQTLNFTANGTLTGYTASAFAFPMTNGANNLNINLDMTGTTQFGSAFNQNSLVQNGYTNGAFVGITIEKNGDIVSHYSNEEKTVLSTLQLANFRNPEGLKPLGDNVWGETSASGQALDGQAGVGLFGSVEAGVVEASNVDMTQELVAMIIAQRAFQANAQTIKTQDEVLQQAVNLK
jgi:flagellar hook protein FlgE